SSLSLDRLVPHPHDENFRHSPSAPQPPSSTASPKLSPSQDKLFPSRARLAQTSATRGPACLRYIQIPLPIALVCVAGQRHGGGPILRFAEYNSAIQQIQNPRYVPAPRCPVNRLSPEHWTSFGFVIRHSSFLQVFVQPFQ